MDNLMRRFAFAASLLLASLAADSFAFDLNDGLVGYWPFDGDATDASGNGNNGVSHGCSSAADRHGKAGGAMHFGIGNYVEVPDSPSLNSVKSGLTIAAWIKIKGWQTAGQRWAALLSKGGYQYCFNLTPDKDTGYPTEVAINVGADFTGASLLGKWVHVAVTFGSDKVCRSYVNGRHWKSVSCPSGSLGIGGGPLLIGEHPPGALEYFNGVMDDLYVYNRALSASEIRALKYNKPSDGFFTVSFETGAYGVVGDMEDQTFDEGERLQLSKNAFTRAGYAFQGWATTPGGIVAYKDEEAITISEDMSLYAVWASPSLALAAESADWAGGSITLRCEDADTSGAAHEYSLVYYDETERKWHGVDGAQIVKASAASDAGGSIVQIAKLKDARFAKRMDGLRPVRYRVVDENGRMSPECVTRNRHGLFVAVDAYENNWQNADVGAAHEAAVFRGAYSRYGGAKGYICTLTGDKTKRNTIFTQLNYMSEIAVTGDIVVFYYVGHGTNGWLTCHDADKFISARELSNAFGKFPSGSGFIAIMDSCNSASMMDMSGVDGMDGIGWIASAQADAVAWSGLFNDVFLDMGWLGGQADAVGGNVFADGDGYVTFAELAAWGQQEMGSRDRSGEYRQLMAYCNSKVLENIVAGKVPERTKSNALWSWLTKHVSSFSATGGDVAAASVTTAANGTRTVGECYDLGVDPEDPDDDFRITHFEMKDGRPVITVNHTADGAGESFESRIRTLGKKALGDADWDDVTNGDATSYRFFKMTVDAK